MKDGALFTAAKWVFVSQVPRHVTPLGALFSVPNQCQGRARNWTNYLDLLVEPGGVEPPTS